MEASRRNRNVILRIPLVETRGGENLRRKKKTIPKERENGDPSVEVQKPSKKKRP